MLFSLLKVLGQLYIAKQNLVDPIAVATRKCSIYGRRLLLAYQFSNQYTLYFGLFPSAIVLQSLQARLQFFPSQIHRPNLYLTNGLLFFVRVIIHIVTSTFPLHQGFIILLLIRSQRNIEFHKSICTSCRLALANGPDKGLLIDFGTAPSL